MVMSLVGAKAEKSKMKRPPLASTDCVAGFTTRSPRLIATAVIGFRQANFPYNPGDMTLQEHLIEDVALIHISGRVTVNEGADVLGDRLRQLVEEGRTKVVLGFGDVPYVDSTALSVLLRARATLARRGGALKLLHVRGHVRELLEVTQLLRVFEAFDSDAEAVASFASPS